MAVCTMHCVLLPTTGRPVTVDRRVTRYTRQAYEDHSTAIVLGSRASYRCDHRTVGQTLVGGPDSNGLTAEK
jgi:hypothetical protein